MEFTPDVLVTIKVNGRSVTAAVTATESLLDFLRNRAENIDVKCGCNKGDCGTCTVVFAGQTVKSCLVLAAQANNEEVWTLQGLTTDPLMQELQNSFVMHGAVQCGFCTPGMLVTARSFLAVHPNPTRTLIKESLAGNLCRCTGYKKIVDAVEAVATAHNMAEQA